MKITWVLVVAGVKRTEQGSVSDGDFCKNLDMKLAGYC